MVSKERMDELKYLMFENEKGKKPKHKHSVSIVFERKSELPTNNKDFWILEETQFPIIERKIKEAREESRLIDGRQYIRITEIDLEKLKKVV